MIAILLIALANVVLLGVKVGRCVDYAAGSGLDSYCESGPAIGDAGAWLIGTVSVLAIGFCAYRLVKSPRIR